jgi:multidrug resistance protein, MATE family
MENRRGGAEVVMSEVKTQLRLATPLAVGSLLQKIIQTISLMFVGRLGELPLASASLATSFAAVTGFSVMVKYSAVINSIILFFFRERTLD